jgi:hypothetical protein
VLRRKEGGPHGEKERRGWLGWAGREKRGREEVFVFFKHFFNFFKLLKLDSFQNTPRFSKHF